MQRTQIYLPKAQLNELKRESRQKQTTVSALIRAALEHRATSLKPTEKKYTTFMESLEKVKKFKEKGPKDLASRVDYYLYEQGV